jgi:RNA polymerase sigma-70 factor (ECF subfamily)
MIPGMSLEDEVAVHRAGLITYAYRLTGDADDAEDVVHAAMVKALQAIRSGTGPANLRAWLYKITHNEAMNSRRRSQIGEQAVRRRPAPGPAPATRQDLTGLVQRELRTLDEPYRSTLTLKYLQHLKLEEVAEILGLPLGTVKSHVARGLRQLTERLGGALDKDV